MGKTGFEMNFLECPEEKTDLMYRRVKKLTRHWAFMCWRFVRLHCICIYAIISSAKLLKLESQLKWSLFQIGSPHFNYLCNLWNPHKSKFTVYLLWPHLLDHKCYKCIHAMRSRSVCESWSLTTSGDFFSHMV